MVRVGIRRLMPIAVHTKDTNAQHYEVPAPPYRLVLGRRLKYSCALWSPGIRSLDEAEEAMVRDVQQLEHRGCRAGSEWLVSHYLLARR